MFSVVVLGCLMLWFFYWDIFVRKKKPKKRKPRTEHLHNPNAGDPDSCKSCGRKY